MYALNLADLSDPKLHIAVGLIVLPNVRSEWIDTTKDIDSAALVLDVDDEQALAIIHTLRIKMPTLRAYSFEGSSREPHKIKKVSKESTR
jgi:hypothetical protein